MKGYKFAVEWIVENDDPTELNEEVISGYISTMLIADLFERSPKEVAKKIGKRRRDKKEYYDRYGYPKSWKKDNENE